MSNDSSAPPLARWFTPASLPGALRKKIVVPTGRIGVQCYPDGESKAFATATEITLSLFNWLFRKPAAVGYVPAEPFHALWGAQNLLSGDGRLLDFGMTLHLKVNDPARFLRQQVARVPGTQAFTANDLTLPQALPPLEAALDAYAADDLIAGRVNAALQPIFATQLQALLGDNGLQLIGLHSLWFYPVEKRAERAQKILAFQDKLRLIELDQRMSEDEHQARLRELQQLAAQETGLPLPAAQSGTGSAREQAQQWGAVLQQTGEQIQQGTHSAAQSAWRMLGLLFGKQTPAEDPRQTISKLDRELRDWFRTRWWIIPVIAVCAVFSLGYSFWTRNVPLGESIEGYLIIWTAPVGLLIETLIAFYKKRDELMQAYWHENDVVLLDDLVRNQPQKLDALVRQQCSTESRAVYEILRDLRSQATRAQNMPLAKRLKAVEERAEELNRSIQNTQHAIPPYLQKDLRFNRANWLALVEYDETLLASAAKLANLMHTIRQNLENQPLEDQLTRIERALNDFSHAFASRSRILKQSN
ncbi:MAG: hypothetical protein OHK0052_06920 [Anaerolineales bacterium]